MTLLVDKLGTVQMDSATRVTLENICIEVVVQGEIARKASTKDRLKKVKRYQFFEIMVRMSLHLFTSRGQRKAEVNEMIPIIDTYRELSPSQAFHIFLEYLLKPFVTSLKD